MTQQPAHRRARNATRVRRAAALLPLGVISVSWTLAVAGAGLAPVPAAGGAADGPDARAELSLPGRAVEAPASISGVVDAAAVRPVQAVATGNADIPAAALAAYQRAATIIGGADRSCGLEWPLLAAIGEVESGHGSVNGNRLSPDGVAVPGVIGIALDGSRGTASISDTDGGRLDGDGSWDRAVGPMQFIPSTWAVVGVDADDDGERNPQDVDDAALAAAVHLCSGADDLSTATGQRAAVLRYNRSSRYADLVLRTARTYGDFNALPAAAGVVVSPVTAAGPTPRGGGGKGAAVSAASPSRGHGAGSNGSAGQPAGPRADGPGSGGGQDRPAAPPVKPTPPVRPAPPEPARPAGPVEVVSGLLTTTEAILACTLSGLSQLLEPGRFNACVSDRTS